ncbi:unnamed protein product [Clonostachys rhizophaga]|uniref:Uncharacterized protein n=1 Tax=Clonostachys rhizophaga TaxID=160324 RepID=A0A9N9W3E1_9HYPO|nr:unnamed protein product [Clonostachys rhizophaga]
MNESTQGNNSGDLTDPNQEVSLDDLVAEHLALVRDFSEKIKLKEELFGLQMRAQQLLTNSEMRRRGTPVPKPEKRVRHNDLNSQRSFFKDGSAALATDLDDLKAVEDMYDQQIAYIRSRLQEIRKIIEKAHPEVVGFNVEETGDI